ncbi:hypothetical protein CC80DRAFT_503450 [Byssothecium circinans]|uniref:Uncharacterized protein n=1 Tax=Byssothecium circinans TaxID=147558 RepID=A0A6A5U4J0_9PLEO|nr:hypothetical protein CC80DRAFT_503450 [Byssothecium circinans]
MYAWVESKKDNIRLVTKSTGHGINGRSDGYGSLELWLRYHRSGIEFHPQFPPSDNYQKTAWNGSVIKILAAYRWQDVYPVAKSHDAIVAGGSSGSVGVVSG